MQYSRAWATTQPEEAEERLAEMYGGFRLETGDPRRFGVSVAEAGDATASFASMEWTGDGRARTDGNSFFLAGDVYRGDVSLRSGGETFDVGGVVLLPPHAVEARWTRAHRTRAVRVERSGLLAFARDHLGSAGGAVTFTAARPISPVHELLWRSVERHIREDVAAHDELLHNDLIWEAAARHIVGTLLTVFPNSTLGVEPAADGAHALPATIRRAIAFMEEHLSEPISTADIAEAARLSPRGLQDAFRRMLDRTPTEQLRLLRLEAARSDLLNADPADGATVAAIARRWGFAHGPRFSAAYRERYGETPRETLRR